METMIPQQIINEAAQYKNDCIRYVNDSKWMSNAADYFRDCAIRDSQRSIDDLAKDKWSYLKYRANAKDTVWGLETYIDKPARAKYLAILGAEVKE